MASPREVAFPLERFELGGCALRPIAGPPEAAALAAMLCAIDPWRRLGFAPEGMTRSFLADDDALARYAVEVGGVARGVLCVRHPWLRGPYLQTIALDPGLQGAGLGGALLEWLEGRARAVSRNLWLLVTEFNTGARRFYARHGFVEIGPIPELIGEGVAEILMRKRLG
jgi:GNAT superfamily N-acetyltransferase